MGIEVRCREGKQKQYKHEIGQQGWPEVWCHVGNVLETSWARYTIEKITRGNKTRDVIVLALKEPKATFDKKYRADVWRGHRGIPAI